jgi:hypothetical protein
VAKRKIKQRKMKYFIVLLGIVLMIGGCTNKEDTTVLPNTKHAATIALSPTVAYKELTPDAFPLSLLQICRPKDYYQFRYYLPLNIDGILKCKEGYVIDSVSPQQVYGLGLKDKLEELYIIGDDWLEEKCQKQCNTCVEECKGYYINWVDELENDKHNLTNITNSSFLITKTISYVIRSLGNEQTINYLAFEDNKTVFFGPPTHKKIVIDDFANYEVASYNTRFGVVYRYMPCFTNESDCTIIKEILTNGEYK